MEAPDLHNLTIKDIARLCNVSTQTVSRVLNNRADVAPATRLAVEKVIADLDYAPSAVARGLRQQSSYTLGVITSGLKYKSWKTTRTVSDMAKHPHRAGSRETHRVVPIQHPSALEYCPPSELGS
jgi:DNA-binding LacI/PurR family transcriptional regulator